MKFLKCFVVGLILCVLAVSFVEAKSFSSGSRGSFSSSRSFSSSSSKSFSSGSSSKSFSSSSTKSSSSAFSKSVSVSPTKAPFVASGTTKIDSSKVKFSDKSTMKTMSSIKIKPRANYTPSTYGTYSRNYYSSPSGFNSNWLMYYLVIDSMSDAAVMTAMANRDGFDEWKNNAVESGDAALVAKVAALESRMEALNATNATNGTYMDPLIEAQLKQAVDGADVGGDDLNFVELIMWIIGGVVALAFLFGIALFMS